MASLSLCLSSSSRLFATKAISPRSSSPSMSLVVGGRSSVSLNAVAPKTSARSGLLHCSFLPTFSSLSSSSGVALQFGINAITGVKIAKRRSLVVRAGKYLLGQTKRNRSRKSLARTHGFRKRMRTTSGRALLKRRRAKGRRVLCPKSNPKYRKL